MLQSCDELNIHPSSRSLSLVNITYQWIPDIAIVGALSIAVELHDLLATWTLDPLQVFEFVKDKFSYLKTVQPAAVNFSMAPKKFT